MPPKINLSTNADATKMIKFRYDISKKCNDVQLFSSNADLDRIEMDKWVLPNRKDFMNYIKTDFNSKTLRNKRNTIKLWKDSGFADIGPFKHQKFVSDYLSDNSPYRGLLLYHGLGSGKSGASIMIGEGFKKRHVVILLPASLRDNYISELQTFAEIAYKKNYHWCKIRFEEGSSKLEKEYLEIFKQKGLDSNIVYKIQKNYKVMGATVRGLWMIDYTKTKQNYNELTQIERDEIDAQIKIMVDHKYSILHYNAGQYTITKILERLVPNYKVIYSNLFGEKAVSSLTNADRDNLLNYIYDPANNIDNPFNNKVLIVDEIHNLTSKMIGSGFNGSRLYELIIRANNLKIVFLSGTPVINNPYELALMFNMLRGFVYSFVIPLSKKTGNFNSDELTDILYQIETIDRITVNIKDKKIEITRLPLNFVNKYIYGKKDGVMYSENNAISEQKFLDNILEKVHTKGYQLDGEIDRNMYTMFPGLLKNSAMPGTMRGSSKYIELAERNFTDTYVDKEELSVNNVIQFKNRILGLVSFYNEISGVDKETGANLFPDKEYANIRDTTVEMSNFQFIEYAAKRRVERKLEDASKSKHNIDVKGAIEKLPSYFKVFSRQKGVFVFPPNIKRPIPPKNNKFIKRKITRNTHYKLRDEEMEKIIVELKKILAIQKGDDRLLAYKTYIESFSATSPKTIFIEKVVGEIMEKSGNRSEYMEWLSTHDFDQDELEIPDVSEEEGDYKTQCLLAIGQLDQNNLTVDGVGINLKILSPKYALMIQNINNSPGNVFCYSQFRSVEGIEIFSRALTFSGYTQLQLPVMGEVSEDYNEIKEGHIVRYESSSDEWKCYKVLSVSEDQSNVELEGLEGTIPKAQVFKCKFALWTGTESVEVRRGIQELYNNKSNMYGQECLILLTTQSGSEGISLMNVRQVHIMEPYWNNVRINQVIGRARRIKSHIYLPERHRNVKIYQYIIKFTKEQLNGNWITTMDNSDILKMIDGEDSGFDKKEYEAEEGEDDPEVIAIAGFSKYAKLLSREILDNDKGISSDEVLHNIAMKKEQILDEFLKYMKETSVDCEFNMEDNIKSNPDHSKLSCYNNIHSETDYSFDLVTNESQVSHKTEQYEVKVQKKFLNIGYVTNGKRITLIIDLPVELHSVTHLQTILQKLPNGYSEIYDYYLFNNLYYKDLTVHNALRKIGNFKRADKISFEFNSDFISRIDDYIVIEQCISQLGKYTGPPSNQAAKIQWSESIRECHKSLTDPEQWECPMCNTQYGTDTIKCKNCDLSKEDLLSFQRDTGQSIASSSASVASSSASGPSASASVASSSASVASASESSSKAESSSRASSVTSRGSVRRVRL